MSRPKTIACVDINGKTKEFDIESLKWRPSVYAIVVRGGNILLSKQFGDKYDLPGGGVDIEESLERAVIRETKEETGIDVKRPQLVGTEESFFWDSHFSQNAYHALMLYCICEYVGGNLSTDGFDEAEREYAEIAEWLPLGTLDSIRPASTVDYRPIIKQALKEK